eukprot:g2408.t1
MPGQFSESSPYDNRGPLHCSDCASGHYASTTGMTACVSCAAGRFGERGASACNACAPGTFVSQTGQAACVDCAPGQYVSTTGMTACASCAAGRFRDRRYGASACNACAPGTFANRTGQAACVGCAAGQYASAAGAATCSACAPGHHSDRDGQATCTACVPGRAQATSGAAVCAACEPGRVQPTIAATSCVACQLETRSGQTTCEEVVVKTGNNARYTVLERGLDANATIVFKVKAQHDAHVAFFPDLPGKVTCTADSGSGSSDGDDGSCKMTMAGHPRNDKNPKFKPACTPVGEKQAVRCCNKNGQGKVPMSKYGCNKDKTFAEAKQICEGKGYRLCTAEEIEMCKTCGTGCGYDNHRVWTSTGGGGPTTSSDDSGGGSSSGDDSSDAGSSDSSGDDSSGPTGPTGPLGNTAFLQDNMMRRALNTAFLQDNMMSKALRRRRWAAAFKAFKVGEARKAARRAQGLQRKAQRMERWRRRWLARRQGCWTNTTAYEIVIGGWNNTQSAIRRSTQGANKAVATTDGINSNWTYFWADASGGLVRFGRGTTVGSNTVLQWQDPSPLTVRSAGVMTGWGATGDWIVLVY